MEGEEEEVSSFVCTCTHRTWIRSIMRIEVPSIPRAIFFIDPFIPPSLGARIRESVDTHRPFSTHELFHAELVNNL